MILRDTRRCRDVCGSVAPAATTRPAVTLLRRGIFRSPSEGAQAPPAAIRPGARGMTRCPHGWWLPDGPSEWTRSPLDLPEWHRKMGRGRPPGARPVCARRYLGDPLEGSASIAGSDVDQARRRGATSIGAAPLSSHTRRAAMPDPIPSTTLPPWRRLRSLRLPDAVTRRTLRAPGRRTGRAIALAAIFVTCCACRRARPAELLLQVGSPRIRCPRRTQRKLHPVPWPAGQLTPLS